MPVTQVRLRDKKEIWKLACAICGGTEEIRVDHILPKSAGGSHERFNLQPLCWLCNAKKKHRLTNVELRLIFEADPDWYAAMHAWRRRTKHQNEFDTYDPRPMRRST